MKTRNPVETLANIRHEFGEHGGVNMSIEPSTTFTVMKSGTMPLARMGTVDDMVNACLFLLSDEAGWITAQILAVDGGQIMRA